MNVKTEEESRGCTFVESDKKECFSSTRFQSQQKPLDRNRLVSHFLDKSKRVKPSFVLQKYKKDISFWPSTVDPRTEMNLVQRFFAALPSHYVPVSLAPVAPFGATSSLSKTSQNNILSTTNGAEVMNNIGVPLVLEGLRKIQTGGQPSAASHLATWGRLFRSQKMVGTFFTQHFSVLGICSLQFGKRNQLRERSWLTSHLASLVTLLNEFLVTNEVEGHVEVWLSHLQVSEKLLDAAGIEKTEVLRTAKNYTQTWLENSDINIPNTQSPRDRLQPEVLKSLGIHDQVNSLMEIGTNLENQWSHATKKVVTKIEFCRLRGLGHYAGVCYSLVVVDSTGKQHFLGDGGFVLWASTLTGGHPSSCLVSSLGTELLLRRLA